jgi:two-component system, OmpR family, alkaline phosphatase synthesis response regulator PhoP
VRGNGLPTPGRSRDAGVATVYLVRDGGGTYVFPQGTVGQKRILIVDDEVGIVEVVSSILLDEGYVVEAAPNGREALATMRRKRPDLIVLDTMMPVLDGMATLRAVQADPALAGVRVIMMTALGAFPPHDGIKPADTYLFKPFELEVLVEQVVALIGPARGG